MIAELRLWGRRIGAVSDAGPGGVCIFQYDPEFAQSGIQLSPLVMPLAEAPYEFPSLPREAFHGLPGLLADSLPDRFGHSLIDAWLATEGRSAESFGALERLCYTGSRGMGALEFVPNIGPRERTAKKIEIDSLVKVAGEVLVNRNDLPGRFHEAGKSKALKDILNVGTSAGGARAKAVIAWNAETNEVRSGHVAAGEGFGYWLLKFDGVKGNRDKETDDPSGYGAIEFAYSQMAQAAGITMNECRLLEENGRRHFMTRRFDRLAGGEKLHMQSLGALAHFDFNRAGAHSYEQALLVIRQLGLPMLDIEEQFRRMVFNIVARNQDDHVKNIAFLMNKRGEWRLSPAFDVTYSYNVNGAWTAQHQMTMNGKRDGFVGKDFLACGRTVQITQGRVMAIIEEVQGAVGRWMEFASDAGVSESSAAQIRSAQRVVMATALIA
ncbi:MAG: HipA domain-containing protein [Gemmatimonadaceae bacterium]